MQIKDKVFVVTGGASKLERRLPGCRSRQYLNGEVIRLAGAIRMAAK